MQKLGGVRIQREARDAVNSSTLSLTPTFSKMPNSTMREVFVESSKGSRFPD